jgi:uncharacterized protein YneF (UPF0154 family)
MENSFIILLIVMILLILDTVISFRNFFNIKINKKQIKKNKRNLKKK